MGRVARHCGSEGGVSTGLAAAAKAAAQALALAPGATEQKALHVLLSRLYHLLGDESAAREHQVWIDAH